MAAKETLDSFLNYTSILGKELQQIEDFSDNTIEEVNNLLRAAKIFEKKGDTKVFFEHFKRFNINVFDENVDTANINTRPPVDVNTTVKLERISVVPKLVGQEPIEITDDLDNVVVKAEPPDGSGGLMLPPRIAPRKGRKAAAEKSTSASSKSGRGTRNTRKNSELDVILNDTPLESIPISDEDSAKSDQEPDAKEETKARRTIKTKKAQKNPEKQGKTSMESANGSDTNLSEKSDRNSARSSTRSKQSEKMITPKIELNTVKITPNTGRITRSKRPTKAKTDATAMIETAPSKTDNPQEIENAEDLNPKRGHRNDANKLADSTVVLETAKRSRSPSNDNTNKVSVTAKKTKSSADVNKDSSAQSVYEDAKQFDSNETFDVPPKLSNSKVTDKLEMAAYVKLDQLPTEGVTSPPINVNATMILEPAGRVVDETIIVKQSADYNMDDMMTDDESPPRPQTVTKQTGAIPKLAKKAAAKQTDGLLFNPFESSPVKKRVEAFEKLGTHAHSSNDKDTPIRTKKVIATPTQKSRVYPHATGSASKANPLASTLKASSSSSTTSLASAVSTSGHPSASASAMKRSQLEFQERELRRRQKEAEAMRKREQLQAAQAEERRRRAENHELKMNLAQQKKEALEKGKLKHLDEIQRLKEDKARQVLAEKQERYLKLKEEHEKKRLLAKKHQMDVKQRGDEGKSISKPIYMAQPMPLLPTADCYDSDDEARKVKVVRNEPAWTSKAAVARTLRLMAATDNRRTKYDLYSPAPCTPDLRDIFQDIDPRKLSRTSSAVWRHPPRYTLVSKLTSFTEEAV